MSGNTESRPTSTTTRPSTTPMNESPAPLQIDSRENSPPSTTAGPVMTPISGTPCIPDLAPVRMPITPVVRNQAPRTATTAGNVVRGGRSPQTVTARSGSINSQYHAHQSGITVNPIPLAAPAAATTCAVPTCVHQSPNLHSVPTSNSAGVILPFPTGGGIHSQHYGLLATSTFGPGGGQTIIVNQYGQPVGVVSPSPAAASQSVTLPSHSAAAVQACSSPASAQFPPNQAPPASVATMNRAPLIMAYRQPVPQQGITATPHPQSNVPTSNSTNPAVAAAAAAAAAASMHSVPLFPSHFNPFAACNAPILLPTGQMVFRTPQGQLIGFQVPTMAASHHPVAVPPPPTLEQQAQQQAPVQSLQSSGGRYPHVLPKTVPSTTAASSVYQIPSGTQPQQAMACTGAGPSPASMIMPPPLVPNASQHQSIPTKVPHKTMPVLPMVPGVTTVPVDGASGDSAQGAMRPGNQPSLEIPGSDAGSNSTQAQHLVAVGASADGSSGKKQKGSRGKGKSKKGQNGNEQAINPNDGKLKKSKEPIDDPGPLTVLTAENSEQMANEIHEMFVRALAEHRDGDGPPQILTHIIDGFVIQESTDPFPISPHPFDDFNLSGVVMTTDSLSEWSAPPQLSPACAKADANREQSKCPHCGHLIVEPYAKAPTFCSGFCYKAYQRMEENAMSPGGKKPLTGTNSLPYSSGTSSVQSPAAALSPKSNLSPASCVEGKSQMASTSTMEKNGDRMLRMALASDSTTLEDGATAVSGKNPEEWTVDDVCNWITSVDSGVAQYASTFRQQEVDGQALLLMQERHLTEVMGMKFGPALKLITALGKLKRS